MRMNKRLGKQTFILMLVMLLLMSIFVMLPTSAEEEENLFATGNWNMGTYTNPSATSRRHILIPCELGERYTISFDSGWRLDLAFMSADGTVASRSIYVSSAIDWTVQPIDGLTPAYLIVTARNSGNTVISAEEWATFPLTCYRKAAVASDMSLIDLFATTDREENVYTFPCCENDTFSFDFSDSDFSLRVAYLDGETVLRKEDIAADKRIVIKREDGKVANSIRITVSPASGGAMTEALWEAFNVSCRKESDHITFATMNYGHWNRGVGNGVADEATAEKLSAWNALMSDANLDILCGQEWCEDFNKSGTVSSSESIFAAAFPYQYSSSANHGKNTASKYHFSSYSLECYPDNTKRDYTVGYVTVNGKKVCVINAHNSTGTTEEAIATRKKEYEHLISLMRREEYVILCGDFNAEVSVDEWKPFTDAGFRMANNGDFGSFVTCEPDYCIDNIIVSPNIKIKSVEVVEDTLSDHNMLIADLQLLSAEEMGDAISMYGAQSAVSTNSVRILAGIQSLMYSAVGFEVERWNGTDNTWKSLDDYETDRVYTSISAAGEKITATDAGYRYLAALVIKEIDSSGVIRISPYVVKNNERIYGDSVVYSLQACYKNADGVYSDYESTKNTVMTVKPAYNSVVVQTDLVLPDFEGYTMLGIPSPFDGGSFENASGIFYEFRKDYYSQLVLTDRIFRFGGRASFGSETTNGGFGLRATSGVKYRQPLTGEKVLAFENISGQNETTYAFDGTVRLSNVIPNDACTEQNIGKTYKFAFYVYVDNLRKWGKVDSSYVHSAYSGNAVTVSVDLYNESAGTAFKTAKSITLTCGKWNLVEYEFTVTEEMVAANGTKPMSSSDSTQLKCPIRPVISFGTTSAFAGEFHIDNIMVGKK